MDGPTHFVRSPPNVEMVETYNEGLLALARQLPAETLRALLEDNTRRLFDLAGPGRPERAPEDVRELFDDALAMAEAVVAAVRPEDLERPTACAEWNVRDVLGHLVAAVRQAERVGRGARTSAAGAARLEHRDRWAPTFAAAARKARAAWADGAGPPTEVRVPWGLVPTQVALAGFVLEVVAHTHDVAAGIGLPELLDERLGNAALGIAERFLPAAPRGAVPCSPSRWPSPTAGPTNGSPRSWVARRAECSAARGEHGELVGGLERRCGGEGVDELAFLAVLGAVRPVPGERGAQAGHDGSFRSQSRG